MAPKEPDGFFITTKDVYDKLTETSDEVAGMRSDFREAVTLLKENRKHVDDHEKRIRFVEKCLYALPITGVAAIGAVLSQVFNIPGK